MCYFTHKEEIVAKISYIVPGFVTKFFWHPAVVCGGLSRAKRAHSMDVNRDLRYMCAYIYLDVHTSGSKVTHATRMRAELVT